MALDEAPPFWWKRPGPIAYALSPLGYVWGRVAAMRMARRASASVGVPVLCVGNFIAGGAGKTPTALALCEQARRMQLRPGLLSRGYGGRIKAPTVVNPAEHNAEDVGDEPLLLAEAAPTVVAANRAAGAALLIAQGCNFVIMDDGFQNPQLAKDYSVVVVDAKRGLGNGFTLPAGPMRAPLQSQLARADAVLVIGDAPGGDRVIRMTARRAKPVFTGRLRPTGRDGDWRGLRALAYAGIADPEKFFDSLERAGAYVVERRSFADHHPYSDEEIDELFEIAAREALTLVTTSKDMARLRRSGPRREELATRSSVFAVALEFEDTRAARLMVEATIQKAERRRLEETARKQVRQGARQAAPGE